MSTVKNENYFVITGWMLNDLGLSGHELMIYAIIYSLTQMDNDEIIDMQYLIDWTQTDEVTVSIALVSLTNKGLLIREFDNSGDILYRAVY